MTSSLLELLSQLKIGHELCLNGKVFQYLEEENKLVRTKSLKSIEKTDISMLELEMIIKEQKKVIEMQKDIILDQIKNMNNIPMYFCTIIILV